MRMNCPILTRDKTENDWSGARRKNSASAGKAIEILMVRASRQSPSRRFQWLWGWSSSTETEKPLRTTSVAGVNEHLFKPGLHDYPWSFGEGRPYCRLTKVIPLIFLNILLRGKSSLKYQFRLFCFISYIVMKTM